MRYVFDGFELDLDRFELRRHGEVVPLEPQVFDVLAYLVTNHQRLVPKEELVEKIWPERYISEAALSSRIMSARKAVGDNGREQRLIRTLHGRGFRFAAEVEAVDEAATGERSGPGRVGEADLEEGEGKRQEIRFCRTPDGASLAYATIGAGPPLVKAANWLSHLEFDWRSPVWRHWLEELSRDHMLARYDERGCGLSDWDVEDFSFESWVLDLETIVDKLGLERFPLVGISQGGPVAIAYAVRHPERVSRLVLYGTYPKGWAARADPAEMEERRALITLTRQGWGRDNPAYRQVFASTFIPGATPEQARWFNDLCRVSASAENAARFMETFGRIDVEELLPEISVPTLMLQARSDQRIPFAWARRMAAAIPGARFVPLDSANHILLETEPAWEVFRTELRRFLAGA
jgi:pimeloyl-ACP methyl ester carboxylesterase/DNA-binding winged helix-turn-helix (wHTH) protein